MAGAPSFRPGQATPTATGGSVSPSDLLTTYKNIVTAINGVAQTLLALHGTSNAAALTGGAVLVRVGNGRLVTVSVLVAGSAAGAIYDANNASATTGQLYVIPEAVGVVSVDLPYSYGLVVAPGTGQTVTVGYS